MAKPRKKWRIFNKKHKSDASSAPLELQDDGSATRPLDVNINNADDVDDARQIARKGKIGRSWFARKGGKKTAHQTAVEQTEEQNDTFITTGTEESAFVEDPVINTDDIISSSSNNGSSEFYCRPEQLQAMTSIFDAGFPEGVETAVPADAPISVSSRVENMPLLKEEPSDALDASFSKFDDMALDDEEHYSTALSPQILDPDDVIAPDNHLDSSKVVARPHEWTSDASPEIQGFLSSAQEQQMGIVEANNIARNRKAPLDHRDSEVASIMSAGTSATKETVEAALPSDASLFSLGFNLPSAFMLHESTFFTANASVESVNAAPPSDASTFSIFNILNMQGLALPPAAEWPPPATESAPLAAEPLTTPIRQNPTDDSNSEESTGSFSEESSFSDEEELVKEKEAMEVGALEPSIEAKIRSSSELAAHSSHTQRLARDGDPHAEPDDFGITPVPTDQKCPSHTFPAVTKALDTMTTSEEETDDVEERSCDAFDSSTHKTVDPSINAHATATFAPISPMAHRRSFDSRHSAALTYSESSLLYAGELHSPYRQQPYEKNYELSSEREMAWIQPTKSMPIDEQGCNVRDEDIDSLQYSEVEEVGKQSVRSAPPGFSYNDQAQDGIECRVEFVEDIVLNAIDDVSALSFQEELKETVSIGASQTSGRNQPMPPIGGSNRRNEHPDQTVAPSKQTYRKLCTKLIHKRIAERRGKQMSPSNLANPGVYASKESMGDQETLETTHKESQDPPEPTAPIVTLQMEANCRNSCPNVEPIFDHRSRSGASNEADDNSLDGDQRSIPRFSSVFDRVPTDLEDVGIPGDVDSDSDDVAPEEEILHCEGETGEIGIESKHSNEDDLSVHSDSVNSESTKEGRRRRNIPSLSFIAAGLNITGLDRLTNNFECSFYDGDSDVESYTDYDAHGRGRSRSRIEEEVEEVLDWADENVLFCGGKR